MTYEVLYRPSYSLLRLRLSPQESIDAEAGAMVSMSGNIAMDTKVRGGIWGALKRKVLGGESFFINRFTAIGGEGEITLAPPLPGDIMHIPLRGGTILVQSGSYIACSPQVEIDVTWAGAKGFFASEGLFLVKISGLGSLFVSSFGAIHGIELAPYQNYIVDTGHVVAFDGSVRWRVRTVGGLKTTVFGGEGLVCEFSGPGRVFLQSRSVQSFLSWLTHLLPSRQGGGRSFPFPFLSPPESFT